MDIYIYIYIYSCARVLVWFSPISLPSFTPSVAPPLLPPILLSVPHIYMYVCIMYVCIYLMRQTCIHQLSSRVGQMLMTIGFVIEGVTPTFTRPCPSNP